MPSIRTLDPHAGETYNRSARKTLRLHRLNDMRYQERRGGVMDIMHQNIKTRRVLDCGIDGPIKVRLGLTISSRGVVVVVERVQVRIDDVISEFAHGAHAGSRAAEIRRTHVGWVFSDDGEEGALELGHLGFLSRRG